MTTLLLGRDEVERLLDPQAALAALRAAFAAHAASGELVAHRVRADLDGPGTAMVLFPGMVDGVPVYSVKVHAKFPGEVPAIKGVLLLHESQSGDLLAVMDSTYVTAVRTGLTSALATDLLARRDARRVAIIGTGIQGEFQLRFLQQQRALGPVRAFDTAPGKAAAFAARLGAELGLEIAAAASVEEAVRDAEILLAATWSREPIIHAGMVGPGVHVTTLGPDEPGKCEVAADLIARSVFVCDDRDLALEMGALSGTGLGKDIIAAELGEVIAGTHPGRQRDDEITVFGSVGVAFQDLVVAWQVYRAATARKLGTPFTFLRR